MFDTWRGECTSPDDARFHFVCAMRDSGLSQAGLSRLSGVSPASISRFVRGEGDIQLYSLFCCLDALGYEMIIKKKDND